MYPSGRASSPTIDLPRSLYIAKTCGECPETFMVTRARAKRTTLCPTCKAALEARLNVRPLEPKRMGTGPAGIYVRGVLVERW